MSQLQLEISRASEIYLDYPLSLNHWVDSGFTFLCDGLKTKNRDKLVVILELHGFTRIDTVDFNLRTILKSASIIVEIGRHNRVRILSVFEEGIAEFLDIYHEFFDKYNRVDSIEGCYYVYTPKDGVVDQFLNIDTSKFSNIIPEFYPDIDIERLTLRLHQSDERILILYGKPGVGKTTLLKFLLKSGLYKSVGYAKDIAVVSSSDFWAQVASHNHDLLIFDDLDHGLGPRTEADNGFVSNLLSFSDGIFNNNCKIVITTNQPINKIDGAIIRPGRCFDFLTLNPLNFENAKAIWVTIFKLDETSFPFEAGEVTQAELMLKYQMFVDANKQKDYLKTEQNIRIMPERIGF